ncbi:MULTISPECIES: hypothetical protein [Rhizobium]|uniref:Uncharacterized protein n=1 Tax=Rhizobium gallicum bv. gallicum R602sp TaxID=1041138 RepID=A0A0B4WYA1_9HYPH|nr:MULTISPECIES: hypothetical protein [Rhizobium]AJD39530.1 hypothetical protein RGR602_CH00156 [Rhizobium gallicum bv. gallicum R602sp]
MPHGKLSKRNDTICRAVYGVDADVSAISIVAMQGGGPACFGHVAIRMGAVLERRFPVLLRVTPAVRRIASSIVES